MSTPAELSAEDNKLVVLARATKARTGAREGAAVRDLDGRTYASATLSLASLEVSAVAGCLSMAASSGAKGLEAVVLLGSEELNDGDRAALTEFAGVGVPIYLGSASGAIGSSVVTA